MKRKIAFMLSMLLLACPAQMTAFAEDEQSTPGYIPEGLPVAVNTIEYVDAETQAVLFAMRDQLRENVYVNFPDTSVHAVVASDIVGKVYVMLKSSGMRKPLMNNFSASGRMKRSM